MTFKSFPALPGIYHFLFLYWEPASTIIPYIMIWVYPGSPWFHHQLVPTETAVDAAARLDARTDMAMKQLANCYIVFGVLLFLVFRTVRDTLSNNPVVQERIVGSAFVALALADTLHMVTTWSGLPDSLKYTPREWNLVTHCGISFIVANILIRGAWFLGIGRTRYHGMTSSPGQYLKSA
ncbi:hypothetical protein CPC08DRAFT_669251 [Agrocybe pediades]|nr:hypothetical protein CPC08DRAFT_669251 [Agrocybe pediades]